MFLSERSLVGTILPLTNLYKDSINMKFRAIIISLLLMPISPFVVAASEGSPASQENDNATPDVTIDLSEGGSRTHVLNKTGWVNIRVKNMIPKLWSDYLIQSELTVHTVKPLQKPASISPEITDAEGVDICELNDELTKLENASDSEAVATLITEIRSVNKPQGPCSDTVEKINALLKKTESQVEAYIDESYDSRITVSLGSSTNVVATSLVKPIRREWITSYGFGFVDNRDQHYHTVGNSVDGYIVAHQQDRQSLSYASLVVFTYPLGPIKKLKGSGIEWGLTGGIGATQENVSALAGVSAIVNKNYVLTIGASFQEFAILKGQYSPGDNVGSTPLDSSVLADKTFRAAAAIVLSYRFGSK